VPAQLAQIMESHGKQGHVQVCDGVRSSTSDSFLYERYGSYVNSFGDLTVSGHLVVGELSKSPIDVGYTILIEGEEMMLGTNSLVQEKKKETSNRKEKELSNKKDPYRLNRLLLLFPTMAKNIEAFKFIYKDVLYMYRIIASLQAVLFAYTVAVNVWLFPDRWNSPALIIQYCVVGVFAIIAIVYWTPLARIHFVCGLMLVVLTYIANYVSCFASISNVDTDRTILGQIVMSIVK
jgi:hypothetical protein